MPLTPIDNILGAALSGVLITSSLFGVITCQTVKYFQSFPRDPLYIKLLVTFVWSVQCVQIICTTRALWWYLVAHHADIAVLHVALWEGTLFQTVTVISSMATQTFFAFRIYHLSSSFLLGAAIEVLVLLQCGLGLATSIQSFLHPNFAQIIEKTRHLVLAWLAVEGLSDIAITATVAVLLYRQRTGIKRTDSMLNRMIVYSVQTSAITCVVDLIILISFARANFHFLVYTFGVPFGAVYTFALLANLHSRSGLKRRFLENTVHETPARSKRSPLSPLSLISPDASLTRPPRRPSRRLKKERPGISVSHKVQTIVLYEGVFGSSLASLTGSPSSPKSPYSPNAPIPLSPISPVHLQSPTKPIPPSLRLEDSAPGFYADPVHAAVTSTESTSTSNNSQPSTSRSHSILV